MYSSAKRSTLMGLLVCLIAASTSALATTKGLNQIVTPDIQPVGVLSVSVQGQNANIGNSEQAQFELGLTKNFEVAVFQGFKPGQTVFNAELGLVQSKSFLLSTGIIGVQNHTQAQPFLEGGYYHGKGFVIAGIENQDSQYLGILGFGYQAAPKLLLSADYIAGSANFTTLGVTYALSRNLSFNPAVYISNSHPRHAFGYGVLSWNMKVW